MASTNETVDEDSGEIVVRSQQDFMTVLRMLNFGDVAKKLSAEYNTLFNEVMRLNRSGSVTLKLTIKPVNKGGVTQMELYPMVSISLPKEEMGADMMYVGDRGLQREHPRQREIEGLRAVDNDNRAPARAIVDVEAKQTVRAL
jgi:hypothetical protein